MKRKLTAQEMFNIFAPCNSGNGTHSYDSNGNKVCTTCDFIAKYKNGGVAYTKEYERLIDDFKCDCERERFLKKIRRSRTFANCPLIKYYFT